MSKKKQKVLQAKKKSGNKYLFGDGFRISLDI